MDTEIKSLARKTALEIHGHKSEADIRYWCNMTEQDKVDRTEDLIFAQLETAHQQAVNERCALLEQLEACKGALRDLLFVYENADETGYVTDVGFVKGFDEIPERCHALLGHK